jgi:uncharacterized protein YjaZ
MEEELKITLAHELIHAHNYRYADDTTFPDILWTEGLATYASTPANKFFLIVGHSDPS